MHSIFACVNVWIHYIFRGGQSEGKYGELHSLHTLTIASHGAMSYLDTRHNFRHIISDFTAVSHLTMELAARGGRTVGASKCHWAAQCWRWSTVPVVQLYSVQCTVYSGHPVQLSAHGPLLSGARLVTPPGPQRKSPFILGLVLQPPPPTASFLHYHIIMLAGARTWPSSPQP